MRQHLQPNAPSVGSSTSAMRRWPEEQRPVRQRRLAANGELGRENHGVAQRQGAPLAVARCRRGAASHRRGSGPRRGGSGGAGVAVSSPLTRAFASASGA